MKRFLEGVMQWKTQACMLFTGSMLLYMVIALIMGEDSLSIRTVFSVLGISAIGTFFQLIAFTDYIFKNVRYTLRLIIFVIPFGVVITIIAALFDWFPAEQSGSLFIFIGTFIGIFAAMTIGFEIYYKATGRKYDGILGQYKKQKEKENGGI